MFQKLKNGMNKFLNEDYENTKKLNEIIKLIQYLKIKFSKDNFLRKANMK